MKHPLLSAPLFALSFMVWPIVTAPDSVHAAELNETLAPLVENKFPKTVEELWAGFDPRAEPLDVEILKEWEEDGVVLKALRYRVGVFKGQKAMMAAVYGYPKGASKIPGLVQIHGGGQHASAKRGYATISIAWAGRIAATPYTVDHAGVKLFVEAKTTDPNYRLTTEWGAIDAYHDPTRYKETSNGTTIEVSSPERTPLFVKDGAIIPLLAKPVNNTREALNQDLEVRHYGHAPGAFDLYEDDGHSFDYENGAFSLRHLTFRDGKGAETLTQNGPRLFGNVTNWIQMEA